MSEIIVKLKDPRKIAWDQETDAVITGPDPVMVEETHFIRAKINEGVLVEVKLNKTETTAEQKVEADAKIKEVIASQLEIYHNLANGDLSTQEGIKNAMAAKEQINLEGVSDTDKVGIQEMIAEADAKIVEAQNVLGEVGQSRTKSKA